MTMSGPVQAQVQGGLTRVHLQRRPSLYPRGHRPDLLVVSSGTMLHPSIQLEQANGTLKPLGPICMLCVPCLQEFAALPYGDTADKDSKQAEDDVRDGVSGW